MGSVLCAWELGGGFGHLHRLGALVEEMQSLSLRVSLAIPAAFHASAPSPCRHAELRLAPGLGAPRRAMPFSRSYPENLLLNGYWHVPSLSAALQAWRTLCEELRPDLVLAEHAPTALLAARSLGVRRAVVGTGFSVPPDAWPMPSLHPWLDLPRASLVEAERRLLASANPALRAAGMQPLERAADIFAGAARHCCTIAPLDHYEPRPGDCYSGPVLSRRSGVAPAFPDGPGPRVFVYMKDGNAHLRPLLRALSGLPVVALACVPGAEASDLRAWSGPRLQITHDLLDLDSVACWADAAVTEGGFGASVRLLLAGVPLLLCPRQLEQACWSYRVARRGLARAINFLAPAPPLREPLERLLADRDLARAARAFSAEHAGRYAAAARRVVAACCGGSPGAGASSATPGPA